ncbi:hypothetical protein K437DRAFT_258655 [Tilletiaria anomala UBC 951]|uniref:Uncharacterized protein n=1 Tax=Tilletiaria anomala (strain ATCC 24038 / CBS 436.72 / UBC 951) TaxID=1037660 RepID=A0A066VPE3_TILAU|nr:uncharacterized protein K437DRAFT_258655 [Tilletiaria anomala UBC 951]KDN40430.1 hypothetical protein K437DRAFT_258655 [Tilletiaria anomala UBC 951]
MILCGITGSNPPDSGRSGPYPTDPSASRKNARGIGNDIAGTQAEDPRRGGLVGLEQYLAWEPRS